MPEQTPEPEPTPAMGRLQNQQRPRINNNNHRSGNIRNSNLAKLASEARSFKGQIGELPIIGRQYESAGVAFDVLRKAVSDYSVLNLENGDHMVYVIENGEDYKKESGVGEAPIWDIANKDNYGKQQEYSRKLDMFLKDEMTYERNLKKVYTIFIGQCTPALLSGIKSAMDFTEKNKKKDLIWLMDLIRKLSIGVDETENELLNHF